MTYKILTLRFRILILTFNLLLWSCSQDKSVTKNPGTLTDGATTLFTKMNASETGITFTNLVKEDYEFNFLNYPYLYAGAGVGVGDLNNDGLEDIYFVSNFGSNRLYINQGDFKFNDVTESSGTADNEGFSTGVTLLDINNDGWLDIYVGKAGSLKDGNARRNKLFINNQDGSFSEMASQWGLDDPAFTTQIYQLDYDRDGDLDLYLLNYRYDFMNNGRISSEIQRQIEDVTSDHLYRNDGDKFTKVTAEAGLYNKAWGLGVVIGDFNNDGWDDIFVANDFLEPDLMYINQKNGTFKNEANTRLRHISFNSMGADFADLDNDMYEDLITLDMLAENYARSKENMASMSTENFMGMVRVGYHHAYMANMLHMNMGNGTFRETGQLSGITKTDWSWAPLIADFDNDGLKDIFVTNGVYKDYHNQDFRTQLRALNAQGKVMKLEDVVAMLPAEKLSNYIFKNQGDLMFKKMITDWGLEDPNFSNGGAYADLDNDGDLDLVVNNISDPAGVYRNNSNENFIQIDLKGSANNPMAIGALVVLNNDGNKQLQKVYMARGYQSTVSPVVHFGLGAGNSLSEVIVKWPDGKVSRITDVLPNQRLVIDYDSAVNEEFVLHDDVFLKQNINSTELGLDYVHVENDFNDFDLQLLIPQKQSTKGTGIARGDINNDGLQDLFIGNARNAAAAMYIQNENGKFTRINQSLWSSEAKYEDADALFFDADYDGDQDLYVVSAGYELNENDPLLQDRLYLNDGKGNFRKNNDALPEMRSSGGSVAAADVDRDGDMDLFVGGNVVPGKYPLPPQSFLLKNENGRFRDASADNESLANVGMISEALFSDFDSDGDPDLILAGEWMKPTFFENTNGQFSLYESISGFDKTEGWWFSCLASDFDGDGDDDYFFGNLGMNNKFQPNEDKPIYIYARDFDENGSFDVALSKINDGRLVPVRGKECSSQQNPFLLEKIQSYQEFASLDMNQIYGEQELQNAFRLTAYMFESVYAENLGNGQFAIKTLPNQAQLGPTMSYTVNDFNNDGHLDIIGIGAIFDAEVETIRYDSNYGYVLLGDGNGNFVYSEEWNPFITADAKDIETIEIGGKTHYIVVSNNSPLDVFTFNP